MTDYLIDAIEALRTVLGFSAADIVPVWYCKTAENWKAILVTARPEDKHVLYEVTHIGSEDKTVIDRYSRTNKWIL